MTVDLQAREIQPLRNTFSHVARYVGDDKPATRYQEATFGAQATSNFHYRPTWDPEYELFDASRSKVVLADWYCLKDPRQFYYGTWTMARARQQDAIEAEIGRHRDCLNTCSDLQLIVVLVAAEKPAAENTAPRY